MVRSRSRVFLSHQRGRFGFSQLVFFSHCGAYVLKSIYRCVHYGVLPYAEAQRMFKIVAKRKKDHRLGVASSPPRKKKTKSRVKEDVGSEPDMQVSGADKVGSSVL